MLRNARPATFSPCPSPSLTLTLFGLLAHPSPRGQILNFVVSSNLPPITFPKRTPTTTTPSSSFRISSFTTSRPLDQPLYTSPSAHTAPAPPGSLLLRLLPSCSQAPTVSIGDRLEPLLASLNLSKDLIPLLCSSPIRPKLYSSSALWSKHQLNQKPAPFFKTAPLALDGSRVRLESFSSCSGAFST